MNSCLSCIPFNPSSQLPADCQTCMNKAKSEGGAVMQTSQGMNSPLCCVSCLLHSFLLFRPRCCCCAVAETRWSSTGCNVWWGRRKRRGRASRTPAALPPWVLRKLKQRYRAALFSCRVHSFLCSTLTAFGNHKGIIYRKANSLFFFFALLKSWKMHCS